ncbi:MAG: hypothetical protein CMG75_10720 [Candidatus Marinimicrobia bacterium]|nr:hypothetical protein [Candidatus Neomarinimicrobiota bacterium]|tara:strand:- start:2672 stop:3421 length:750 start_codon:yes stop_codon:yes gene_type:complete
MDKSSSSGTKFYGADTNDWIGIIIEFDDQKTQYTGLIGYGWRYKVAIMGFHPSEKSTLSNKDITYAIVAQSPNAGSGAAERLRTPRISQGDVVMGKFLDGDKRQVPVITGILGRTSGTKFGTGRFESKTGYVDGASPKGLVGSETSEAPGPCTASTKSLNSTKGKIEGAAGKLLNDTMGITEELKTGVFENTPAGRLNNLDFGSNLDTDIRDAVNAEREMFGQDPLPDRAVKDESAEEQQAIDDALDIS